VVTLTLQQQFRDTIGDLELDSRHVLRWVNGTLKMKPVSLKVVSHRVSGG
jgi:hypothetical protein